MSIQCAFTGRLGSDLELRISKNGKPFASASIVVGASDASQWVRLIVFGSLAKTSAAELRKGDACYSEGTIKLDRWTGKDGDERTGLSCVASALSPCAIGNRKPKRTYASPRSAPAGRLPDGEKAPGGAANTFNDDDQIPFAPEVR